MRGTTQHHVQLLDVLEISIHVPREGDDTRRRMTGWPCWRFQSTSPVRGTTTVIAAAKQRYAISIHVPREGDDPPRIWLPT